MNQLISLEQKFAQAISDGLMRSSIKTTSDWALRYVVLGNPIPGPMSFKYHPWSKEWMDCQSDWIGMKAAQLAMTHSAIMVGMHANDILNLDVMYILPKQKPDAANFSRTKFDPILKTSPHIQRLYHSVSTGLKQAGSSNFYLLGARSRSGLKMISIAKQIFDEYDEMPQSNITLAEERQSGYFEELHQTIKISTPTLPDFGIHKEFGFTNQEHYFFRCPRCSRFTEFEFPNSLIVTTNSMYDEEGLAKSHYICPLCKGLINQEDKLTDLYRKAHWEQTANRGQTSIRGFYLNQFYSCTLSAPTLAKKKLKAEQSNEPLDWQEWHNSAGGVPHIPEGARVPESVIDSLLSSHSMNDTIPRGLLTMGVDAGHKFLHIEIDQWFLQRAVGPNLNQEAICKPILFQTWVNDFHHLDDLMRDYQILMCVVDAEPEGRQAIDFCNRFFGHAYRWFPNHHKKAKDIDLKEDESVIQCNRTNWLDVSQGRFKRRGALILPKDTPREFKEHIPRLIRKPVRDKDGNPTATYVSTGADHFGFTRLFNELALPLVISKSENRDITDFL